MSFVSVAVYSFTGMFTRPNEMLPLQIARAEGMETPAWPQHPDPIRALAGSFEP